ncbi:MAG TPA: DMT family transporter [Candidatus Binatia bacterium]|jgi:drug/metabolite transporter (DMT)-like permease
MKNNTSSRSGSLISLQNILAVVVVMVWGVCFVVIKATLGNSPPLFSAAARGLVAGLPLVLVSALMGRLKVPADTWGWIILLALGNVTLGLGAMYISVGPAGSAIPSVLANVQALIVAPFAVLLFAETLNWKKLAALSFGFIGVILTVAPGSVSLGTLNGSLFALLASTGLAAGTLILKHIGRRVDFLAVTAWQYLLGSLPLLLAALMAEDVRETTWTPSFISGLLFSGLVGSAGSSLLWFFLVQRQELIRLTAFTFLTPLFGVLSAEIFFRESLSPLNGIGLLITIAGVAGLQWNNEGVSFLRSRSDDAKSMARFT